jgi:hypothetical protein
LRRRLPGSDFVSAIGVFIGQFLGRGIGAADFPAVRSSAGAAASPVCSGPTAPAVGADSRAIVRGRLGNATRTRIADCGMWQPHPLPLSDAERGVAECGLRTPSKGFTGSRCAPDRVRGRIWGGSRTAPTRYRAWKGALAMTRQDRAWKGALAMTRQDRAWNGALAMTRQDRAWKACPRGVGGRSCKG